MINKVILQEFQQITNYDLVKFFTDFTNFMKLRYNQMVDFYTGNADKLDRNILHELQNLNSQITIVYDLIESHKHRLNNLKWWDLITEIDNVDLSLKTTNKIDKWLRSSVTTTAFSQNIQFDYVLRQNQTLENVSNTVLNERNWQDDWTKIAFDNDLREEDYTPAGGNQLKVYFKNAINSFNIESIVDNIVGEKVLGLDIYRKITFENDDLKTLSYQDSFKQAVLILSTLKKGDNPACPEHGFSKNITAGGNINMVAYPAIFRQMATTFSNDDSMKSFAITKIRRETDALYLDFTVESRLDETASFSLKL